MKKQRTNKQETAQAYIDTNGRPHSIWEYFDGLIIDPDFDKSFDAWLASYKEKHYQLTIMED